MFFIILALSTGAISFARGHQIATHQWNQWNLENHTSTEEFIHILTFKGTLVLSLIQVSLFNLLNNQRDKFDQSLKFFCCFP